MNASRLDLRMLFEFEAIHRLGSLTAAADALGLSQPALSHALTRMRATFDDALFVRTSHGLRPTTRADELAARARRILAFVHAELATIAPFDPAALERVFTVGMSDVAQMVFLPKLITRFRLEAPRCDLTAVSLRPRELTEGLEAGTVDLAIGPFPDLAGSSLRSEPLFERGFRCLLSAEHPRIRRPKITMEQFLGESHLVVSSPGRVEQSFEEFLKARKLKRRIVMSVPHALCIPGVISGSDLIATVPHSVAVSLAAHPGLRVATPPIDTPPIKVAQYWSARFARDPASVWLRSLVGSLFRDNPPKGGGKTSK
jgi:DNA-binding transcriptional LysR family regulator